LKFNTIMKTSLFIVLIFLVGCSDNRPSIKGHWHLLLNQDGSQYLKLDIENDTVALLEGIQVRPSSVKIHEQINAKTNLFIDAQKMILWDGMYNEYKYNFKADTLILIDDKLKEVKFKGVKEIAESCSSVDHFYGSYSVKVDLPVIVNKEKIATKDFIWLDVILGKDKITSEEKLLIGWQEKSMKQLNLGLKTFKAKIAKHDQDKIRVLLNVDKGFDRSLLNRVIADLKLLGYRDLYQRLTNEDGDLVIVHFE